MLLRDLRFVTSIDWDLYRCKKLQKTETLLVTIGTTLKNKKGWKTNLISRFYILTTLLIVWVVHPKNQGKCDWLPVPLNYIILHDGCHVCSAITSKCTARECDTGLPTSTVRLNPYSILWEERLLDRLMGIWYEERKEIVATRLRNGTNFIISWQFSTDLQVWRDQVVLRLWLAPAKVASRNGMQESIGVQPRNKNCHNSQ